MVNNGTIVSVIQSVASTVINTSSKLRGLSSEWGEMWGGMFPSHRHRGVWGGAKFFCFVFSKWHILVNSEPEVLNLKFFFIVSSLSGVWVGVDSVANFGFSSKAMNNLNH